VPIPTFVRVNGATACKKFVRAFNAKTLLAAQRKKNVSPPRETEYKSFGFLGTEVCEMCEAYFFRGEGIKSKKKGVKGFLQCCQHGKVKFDPPIIPPVIADLLEKGSTQRKHFLQHIRTYNTYFAMASFQAKFARLEHNYPHVVKLHGQYLALVDQATPKGYVPRADHVQKIMQSQMLFVDPKDADMNREAFEPNRNLQKDVIAKLFEMLQKSNQLVQSYQRMAVLVEKAKKEWSANNDGERPPTIKLVFKRSAQDTSKIMFRPSGSTYMDVRHEAPVALGNTEIAAVFDTSERPVNVPLYICQEGKAVKLGPRNPLREPLLYPLMYPDGEPKWYKETPHEHSVTAVANKVTLRQYYSFMLHLRKEGYLQRMLGTLTQQWIVEGWVRCEDSDLEYIKNLDYLRVSTRPKLTKILTTIAESEGLDLGREIKLPSSFNHSPAQMQRYYMNSIQMVRVNIIHSTLAFYNLSDITYQIFHALCFVFLRS
jgi:hypothetical protein